MRGYFNIGSAYNVLVTIAENKDKRLNIHQLSRKTGITYSHIHRVVFELMRQKLITGKFKGRERDLKLTMKGDKIATYISLITQELGVMKDE